MGCTQLVLRVLPKTPQDLQEQQTNHSDLFPRIGYVRLQGHKDRDTTIIYTLYVKDMAYTLARLSSTEALDIQTRYVHSLSMDATRVLCNKRICHMQTKGMGRTSQYSSSLILIY